MHDMTLGQKIRELRLSKQMTQKELAGDFITRNMLSQIENDSATPSMKTISYLAASLGKPIGYFVDKGHSEINLSHLMMQLIESNEAGDYESSIELLDKELINNPKWAENKIIMDLYVNSHLYLTSRYMDMGAFEKAQSALNKILDHKGHLLGMSDIYLYRIYDLLAETSSQLNDLDAARDYYGLGKTMIDKLVAAREVQSLYIRLMDGDTEAIVEELSTRDTSTYDPYSLARYRMIVGASLYRTDQFTSAISYLEQALSFYKNEPNSGVTLLLYEQLSKCYSELEEYKKAYDYLQLAQASK